LLISQPLSLHVTAFEELFPVKLMLFLLQDQRLQIGGSSLNSETKKGSQDPKVARDGKRTTCPAPSRGRRAHAADAPSPSRLASHLPFREIPMKINTSKQLHRPIGCAGKPDVAEVRRLRRRQRSHDGQRSNQKYQNEKSILISVCLDRNPRLELCEENSR